MRNSMPARFCLASVGFACVAGALFTCLAQTQRPAEQQSPDKVVISKDEVPFDVVVRDKKGKMIRDLTAADFEVYEDGTKQEINSFRFVSSAGAEAVAPPTKPADANQPDVSTARVQPIVPKQPALAPSLWCLIDSHRSRDYAREMLLSVTWARALERMS